MIICSCRIANFCWYPLFNLGHKKAFFIHGTLLIVSASLLSSSSLLPIVDDLLIVASSKIVLFAIRGSVVLYLTKGVFYLERYFTWTQWMFMLSGIEFPGRLMMVLKLPRIFTLLFTVWITFIRVDFITLHCFSLMFFVRLPKMIHYHRW